MRVIATAGHVDHGKSTLVRALTGIEPDRWDEERRRGLTIDLGYAWTTLPDGQHVAFVDVPGHERFIANMLAGVGPVPAVLLVVAADEGWRQQSQEHLDAINALGITHGVVAITRSDLADPTPTLADVRQRLVGTSLASCPIVAVSAVTGSGMDDLRSELESLCHSLPEPDLGQRSRLWIDRVFTIKGAGTVVTGTLQTGSLSTGDPVQLVWSPISSATIRGLQSLEQPASRADAVCRAAVNLRGVEVDDLGRGSVLLTGSWHLTNSVDARLVGSPLVEPASFVSASPRSGTADMSASPRSGTAQTPATPTQLPERLMAYVGTVAMDVRVRPLDADHVRLTWSQPLPLTAGDRIILRDPGQQRVVAGALVLDADPPPLSKRGAARRRGHELAALDPTLDPLAEVNRRGIMRAELLTALGAATIPEQIRRVSNYLISETQWSVWVSHLGRIVTDYATAHPSEARLSLAAASAAVGCPASLLPQLAADAELINSAGYLSPPGVTASLGAAEQGLADIVRRLTAYPFAAPERDELAALGVGPKELATAVRRGQLIDLGDLIVLLPPAPALAVRELNKLPQPFTTSQARTALDTTRRVVIPLLERLDKLGWTRRLDASHRIVVRR